MIHDELKSTRSNLLILGLSFVVIHIIINLIQSGIDDLNAYLGWNIIRTYVFVGISIAFFFKWKKLTKFEKVMLTNLKKDE